MRTPNTEGSIVRSTTVWWHFITHSSVLSSTIKSSHLRPKAKELPNSRYVEAEGDDHTFTFNSYSLLHEVLEGLVQTATESTPKTSDDR